MFWSSARAARDCAPRLKRPAPASRSAWCANRFWARRTPSWPRAALRPRLPTSTTATTGACISPTPCAAASTSTTGAWPSCMPGKRPTACASSRLGARSSTAPRTAASCSATSAAIAIPRLAHVGDRTGLEMIRTLQDHGIHTGMEVHMECTVLDAADRFRPRGGRLRLRSREGPLHSVARQGRRHRNRRHRPRLQDHQQQLGIHGRRPRARLPRGRRAAGHGIRPVPSHRHGLAA